MILIEILRLLLPALIPSWRFFDEVAPSPRIEFAVLETPQDDFPQWNEFRPRPGQLSAATVLRRLFWNPHWNETLFLVSCSERLIESGDPHWIRQIFKRIKSDLPPDAGQRYVQFRLVFVHREDDALQQQTLFVSPPLRAIDGEMP